MGAAAVALVVCGTAISGRRILSTVKREQTSATVSTTGETLQQSTAFSHGASNLTSFGTGVAPNTHLIRLERCPIHKPNVVTVDQDRPFLHRQTTASLLYVALFVDVFLPVISSIHVRAGVSRIGQHI